MLLFYKSDIFHHETFPSKVYSPSVGLQAAPSTSLQGDLFNGSFGGTQHCFSHSTGSSITNNNLLGRKDFIYFVSPENKMLSH